MPLFLSSTGTYSNILSSSISLGSSLISCCWSSRIISINLWIQCSGSLSLVHDFTFAFLAMLKLNHGRVLLVGDRGFLTFSFLLLASQVRFFFSLSYPLIQVFFSHTKLQISCAKLTFLILLFSSANNSIWASVLTPNYNRNAFLFLLWFRRKALIISYSLRSIIGKNLETKMLTSLLSFNWEAVAFYQLLFFFSTPFALSFLCCHFFLS